MNKKIGIDLGSSRIRVAELENGIVLDEPSCIAIEKTRRKVLAVGKEAEEMQDRVGGNIEVFEPIKSGVIQDQELFTAMLRVFLSRVIPGVQIFRPSVVFSVPASASQVSVDATSKSLNDLGFGEVISIAQSLSASIGAGVPIAQSSGSCVFNMGDGLLEASIISLGSIITSADSEKAGAYLNEKILYFFAKEHSLEIGMHTAERLKCEFLSLSNFDKDKTITIVGKNRIDNSPLEVKISKQEFFSALESIFQTYIELVKEVLRQAPPELSSDILDKGILLTGGLSQLKGLRDYLTQELNIAVLQAENSQKTTITGIFTVLEHLEEFKESAGYQ